MGSGSRPARPNPTLTEPETKLWFLRMEGFGAAQPSYALSSATSLLFF